MTFWTSAKLMDLSSVKFVEKNESRFRITEKLRYSCNLTPPYWSKKNESIFGNNVLFRSSLQRNKPLFATDPFEAGNFAFGNKKTQSSRYSRAKEWKSHMNAYV